MREKILAPSILAADAANLERDVSLVLEGGARWLHLDIMDGHFVPNLSYGPHVCGCLRSVVNAVLDTHLMVEYPGRFIAPFVKAGADVVTVHAEANGAADALRMIRKAGIKPALSIKPKTPVEAVLPYLELVDMLLLMTVEPGFGGQGFLPGSLERIASLRALLDHEKPECSVQIDGGVTLENVKACAEAGADIIVAGSSVFGAADIKAKTEDFLNILIKV